MKIVSFLSKYLFWVFQLIGWSFLVSFIAYAEFTMGSSILYVLLFCISFFITGIVFSSLYRWLLKKYTTLSFTLRNSLKVIGLALICSVAFVLITRFIDDFILLEEKGQLILNGTSENHEENHSLTFGRLFFGFFLFFVWSFLYYTIKAIRKQNNNRIERLRLREKIKSAQLNTLQGHVNGEFLIHVLQSIKRLMPIDIQKSRSSLTDVSELLRYSLSNQHVSMISMSTEIEMLEKYIELFQIDNPNTVRLNYDLSSEFFKNEIPPMLLISMFELMLDDTVLKDDLKKTLTLKGEISEDSVHINLSIDRTEHYINMGDIRFKKINQRLRLMFSPLGKLSLNQLQNAIVLEIPKYSKSIEEK